MNAAQQITERINMRDIFSKYGFKLDRTGKICCPFHNELKPSLGIYSDDKRWHCFGCGDGGNVIDFVMKLYNLDFKQTIVKIDYDFHLCLCTGNLNRTEKAKLKQQEIERKRHLEAKRKEKEEKLENFYDILDMWIENERITSRYKRLSRCAFDYPAEYWRALHYRQCAAYILDCIER